MKLFNKEKKKKEKKQKIELDTETTIADMNVEGFKWYDPNRKAGKKTATQLTKKEYRALLRGAYRSMLPMIGCILAGALFVVLLAVLWLK